MKLSYLCQNDLCQQEIELEVDPGEPPILHGNPDNMFPGSPATFEPEECPHCGTKIDSERVWKKVDEMMNDWD